MNEDKLYDLSMIREISRGNDDFVVKMAQLFIETTGTAINEMKSHLKNEEWSAIGSLAHKIKSSIDTMGITLLREDIRLIEQYGKDGTNMSKLPELLNKTDLIIGKVNDQLRSEFKL